MIVHIITKLTAEQYIVTHGLGFLNINVTINAEPIRLNILVTGTITSTPPTVITASPIRLNINLLGTPVIIPGNVIHAESIRLNLRLIGAIIGADVFILDFRAQLQTQPSLQASINTHLNLLTMVEIEEQLTAVINTNILAQSEIELDEEVMRVRLT